MITVPRREALTYTQTKTGSSIAIPVIDFDDNGHPVVLYPDLEEGLGRTSREGELIVVEDRNDPP